MEGKELQSKIGSMVSLPMGLLLLIFFFVPWLNLTCGGAPIGRASGWQLSVGTMSKVEQQPLSGLQPTQEKKEDKDPSETIRARPWFFLGLILPLAILAAGAMGFLDKMPPVGVGKLLIACGVVGLIVMIGAAAVDYSGDVMAEQKAKQAKPPAGAPPGTDAAAAAMQKQMEEQVSKNLRTETTGILWLSLVLYVLVAGCGAANLFLPQVLGSIGSAQAPPAPPGEGTPAPPAAPEPPADPEPPAE